MSKSLTLLTLTVAVTASFVAGRWTAPESTTLTNSSNANVSTGFSLAPTLVDKTCSLPPVIVKVPTPFEGKSAAEINKKLQENRNRIPSSAAQDEQRQLLEALAAVDPEAAMALAQQLKGDSQPRAVSAVLAIWGEKDPEAAWKWVSPENVYQYDLLLEVFGKNDPEMAGRYAGNLAASRPELAQEVYLAALIGIGHTGAYGAARKLAETALVNESDRYALMNYVAGNWAAYDPQAASQWVMSQSGEAQASALVGLGESWSHADPQAAANFAAGLTGSPQRQLLLQQSISKWLMQDPTAATNWLAAADNHQDYDQAVHSLATLPNLVRDQTATALSWSERIYDSNLRMSAVQQILLEMKTKDPAGAASYARSAPNLSASQRTQLLNSLNGGS